MSSHQNHQTKPHRFTPGNHYKLFAQPELPACDAFRWLTLWIQFLESVHYGHPLNPDDYIFPAMGANGVVQPQEHVSHDTVQNWINEATTGVEIRQASGGSFSTHCFRRGGAQYRFMYAPVGKRWSLAVVRWWGGWAEGENVRMLFWSANVTSRLSHYTYISATP